MLRRRSYGYPEKGGLLVKSETYPRFAHTKFGYVRIVEYVGEGMFSVVGVGDERRNIHRDSLDFRRGHK
jgi:hypothetical protein